MSHRFFRRDSKSDKSATNGTKTNNNNNNNKRDFSDRKATLTPLEFRVTQERQTERPFSNKYNRHWEPGAYNCIVCNAELFKSNTKFESKSGWPAFSNVVDPKRVRLSPDLSHIGANLLLLIAKPDLARTEVSCAECNAHLGHLFKDGPKPTGLRYCINSSSLIFVPNNNSSINYNTENDDMEIQGEKEFPCNPENTCSKGPTNENSSTNFQNNGNAVSRKSQTLPPMASLCLNNISCQRTPTKPRPPVKTELSNSTEAILTSTTTEAAANNTNKNLTCSNNNSNVDSPFTRTSSSRYASSKGASLTAARISFFQTLTSTEPSNKERESAAMKTAPVSRWGSSTVSSISNPPSRPFTNRFTNSTSSNSLSAEAMKNGNANSSVVVNSIPSRRDSNGLYPKPVGVQQISSPPVPLKETSL